MTIAINMQNTFDSTQSIINRPLCDYVESTLTQYLAQLEGQKILDLYKFVLAQVEPSVLKVVMKHTSGNQSQAAALLGINRGTLRKKLKKYQIHAE